MKALFKYLVVAIVILGLIMPLLNLRAQELNNVYDGLKAAKENSELPADEKEKQEAAVRKDALLKILNLSLAEAEDLINDLKALDLNTEEQQEWRDYLIYVLETYREYYEKFKKELTADLSVADSKLLAKGFQFWRKGSYAKHIPLITNFIFIFNEQKILRIAEARLEKITADLGRLEKTTSLNKEEFEQFLDNAKTDLQNAWALNQKAEQSFLDGENSGDVKLLAQASLKEIKNAYKEFLEVSKKVRQLLGL